MTRRPSAAAQRRAVKRQVSAPVQVPVDTPTRWYCGGCGSTMTVANKQPRYVGSHVFEEPEATGVAPDGALLAFAVACPESACDARLVRCVRCGGEKAARAALKAHACRVAT